MARQQKSEQAFLQILRRELELDRRELLLGIGDDAAVFRQHRGTSVLSVDASIEHVHFELSWLSLAEIGARALHAAASDLAAMGAAPRGALCHLTLPSDFSPAKLRALARGQRAAGLALGCPLVGGNLSRGKELSLVTTVFGSAERVLGRAGARAGDELWLIGDCGLAAAGLRLLQAGRRQERAGAARVALRAWRAPEAQIKAGRSLIRRAHALIDVSDGLAADAAQVARASKQRLIIEEALLRSALSPALLELSESEGWDALSLALYGGEDYALLATGPGTRRPRRARCIGHVGRGSGVWLRQDDARLVPLPNTGFDHFSGR